MKENTAVLNCRVNLIDKDNALSLVKKSIEEKKNFQIITINPEMIMNAQNDLSFLNIVNSSDLNIVDGIGVKIALKFQKINQNQIRGVDFSRSLVELASKNSYRIAFLGAKEEVIQKTKENFLKQYPNLKVALTNKFHDRFIVIDDKELYHIGASLKDLGKKCFAISKIEDKDYIDKINNNNQSVVV